ncbi:hypothetical protein Leryth_024331 [Lithospermum erythrorhizon]|nr:hypothetical protein Leryth_024331 [Lithospermum erythrorhizon]
MEILKSGHEQLFPSTIHLVLFHCDAFYREINGAHFDELPDSRVLSDCKGDMRRNNCCLLQNSYSRNSF